MKKNPSPLWLPAVLVCLWLIPTAALTDAPGGPNEPPRTQLEAPSGLRVVEPYSGSPPEAAFDPLEGTLATREQAVKAVQAASRVLMEMLDPSAGEEPASQLANAAAIAVVPGLQEGKNATREYAGVLVARHRDSWSLPVLITLSAEPSSVGIDPDASDLLLFVRTEPKLFELLQKTPFVLGADASAAAPAPNEERRDRSQEGAISAFQRTQEKVSPTALTGAVVDIAQGPTAAYYDLSEQAVRGYYGDERQMVQILLGLAPARQSMPQIPRSALNLQDILKLKAPDAAAP